MATNTTREEESKAQEKESLIPVTATPEPYSTEQANASTSAAPAIDGNVAESKPSGPPLLAAQAALGPPALELGKLNLNAEEKPGNGIAEPKFKGLMASRWASDDVPSVDVSTEKKESGKDAAEPKFKGPKGSRWANDESPSVHGNTDKKKRRRNARKHRAKASENPGEPQAESQDDPPRVQMDMNEFKQDVEKYGLKTLKDSRWAD
ncbi:hypothetical protein ANO14919_121280 [Xylariales sp. No.14919]|nr:hypothetical protein ANO14919_121280 [Xylariales sp. No.14919]